MKAKFINENKIEYLDCSIVMDGKVFTNPENNPSITKAMLKQQGYVDVVVGTKPELSENEYSETKYKLVKGKIECKYIVHNIND